jgi:hypothetical protein
MDLGTLLNPQASNSTSDTQPASTKDQWDAYLSNPATRAALLNFGLSALTGGWGSQGQQIASAIGQGVEAGGQVGANLDKQAESDAAIARQESQFNTETKLKREDLANRRDIANIAANTRITTAGMRLQPRTSAEVAAYNRTFNSTSVSLRQSLPYLQGQLTEDEVINQARDAAESAIGGARGMGIGGQSGAGDLSGVGGGPQIPGVNPQGNLPGTSGSQNQGPVSGQPRIRMPDGSIRVLSPDGKSWVPAQ